MKKGKLIKWLLVLIISVVLFIIGSTCAKAEGAGAEPTPTAGATVDPWSGEFLFPEWMQTEFDFTTPSPVTPVPTLDPAWRDLVVEEGMTLLPFSSSQNYKQRINAWQSYLYDGDTSVWYFKAFNNLQIAVSNNSLFRPYSAWLDSVSYAYYNTNALFFQYSNAVYRLSSSNSLFDGSVANYNFSFSDSYVDSHSSIGIPSDAVSTSNRIVYFLAINKVYPKLYNSPTWFSDVGISEEMLYDLQVVPSVEITAFIPSADTTVKYNSILDPISLRELYRGVTFDYDLNTIFGSEGYLYEITINFSIPVFSSDWEGIKLYRQYLAAHPEITGHVPFYIYWDGSNASNVAGRGAFSYLHAFALSEKQDDRNWLQKLFLPSQAQLTELFQYYAPSVDSDGVFSFAATFRAAMFSWLVDTSESDFTITLPEMTIPINGTRYTFSNEYTYNLTQSLNEAGLIRYIKMATSMMITVLFVNSVITMVFAVFDIHLFDGVKE